jgi:ubiquinone/menaquinone biosynthesis C-methylase UbiE
MHEKKFNPEHLEKLNNPERLEEVPPSVMIEMAGLDNPEAIIDLGAGTAFFSIPFAGYFPAAKVYACDISETMINWIRKNVTPDYENIIPVKMEDSSVPLPDESADFLFMINLHHELDRPAPTLRECHRLLKPGGKIAISDWKKIDTEQGPPTEHRIEAKEIEDQLRKNGYADIRTNDELPFNNLIVARRT